ncbi:hypothetical protein [Helicobacter rodentium]|nr:hypothetical protein [Helicobacter rodentium]
MEPLKRCNIVDCFAIPFLAMIQWHTFCLRILQTEFKGRFYAMGQD